MFYVRSINKFGFCFDLARYDGTKEECERELKAALCRPGLGTLVPTPWGFYHIETGEEIRFK